jgi:2-oxoglutarate ferredoxin oxidoreductase subunit delta
MVLKEKEKKHLENQEQSNVSFFLAWCKRCGNCVAFCPSKALKLDQWGYPYIAHPEKCKACHLCEKLCPDFAIGVADGHPQSRKKQPAKVKKEREIPEAAARPSYERLAPDPANDGEEDESSI